MKLILILSTITLACNIFNLVNAGKLLAAINAEIKRLEGEK